MRMMSLFFTLKIKILKNKLKLIFSNNYILEINIFVLKKILVKFLLIYKIY